MILTAPKITDLPENCTSIIHIKDSSGFAELIQKSDGSKSTFMLDTVSYQYAKSCAQNLARYRDLESSRVESLPGKVNLGELVSDLTAEAQIQKWQEMEADLSFPIGIGAGGTVRLDLDRDGPHGLIAGTTGAGKSELLKCIVASLTHNKSPEQVNFFLIDYKGGSAFDPCLGLPHIAGLATDLNPQMAKRALISLRAELTRREEILRSAGAKDISDFCLSPHPQKLPRLVILVDEFASMAEELPEFLNSLVEIARRGRSLGIHLILATQRPAGAVSANIRSNMNFRICLRVLNEADSVDILDSPLAAQISSSTPGRGILKTGESRLQTFQTAQTGLHTPVYEKPVEVIGGDFFNGSSFTDLEKITTAAKTAAKELKLGSIFKPLADPLPDFLDVEDIKSTNQGGHIQIGLTDLPEKQMLKPLVWNMREGSLMFTGRKSAD